jgi:hypothetical protein|tara:strand:+ start:92 stop:634 length:543 start_codon:yes stop_codon:yes gene_type:complete
MKKIYTLNMKNILKSILLIFIAIYLNSCGIHRPVDARKVSPNANERVKQNQKEGKGITFGNILKKKSGDFQFASSNPMWRAAIEVLDFVPLSNVDYGGGVIVTDWYNNANSNEDSIKLMIQFLTNEIRADGIKVNIYKKRCVSENNCTTSLLNSNLNNEIKLAILKKASLLKKKSIENKD